MFNYGHLKKKNDFKQNVMARYRNTKHDDKNSSLNSKPVVDMYVLTSSKNREIFNIYKFNHIPSVLPDEYNIISFLCLLKIHEFPQFTF